MSDVVFATGSTVVRRDVLGGRVRTAAPHRVLRDDGNALMLAMWPGVISYAPVDWIDWMNGAGDDRRKRAIPSPASGRWRLGEWVWRDTIVLTWVGADPDFGLQRYVPVNGSRPFWKVNFERPPRRTRLGIDTFDLLLDLIVDPADLSWEWKDEEEYAQIRRLGLVSDGSPVAGRRAGGLTSGRTLIAALQTDRSNGRMKRMVLAVLALAGALYVMWRPLMMSAPRCFGGHWHGCYDTENGVVLMTIVGLPVAAVVVWGLATVRGGDERWRKSISEVGIVYGTVPMVWLTLMPGPGAGLVPGRISLVPLRDLVTMGPLGIGGNLLIFAALGFFAPMRFAAAASVPRILALGVGCSVLVEVAQYAFQLDRVSSVDDVLVNATGAVLAGLASRRWWRRRWGRSPARDLAEAAPVPGSR